MSIIRTLTTILFAAGLIGSANAADSATVKIEMLRGFNSTGSKGLYVELQGAIPNPAGCANSNWARAADSDLADFDQQFAMLLSAHMAGRDVRIQIHDTNCSAGYPLLTNVYVY